MISQITERIFIGDQNDGQNLDALRQMGINCVMNATGVSDNLSGSPDFRYIRMNQEDGQPIPKATITSFLTFMETIMTDPKAKVLIHCGAGVSRASSFTICWLMTCGFGWEEAEALVKLKRDIIAPHPVLKESILEYYGTQ